MRPAISSEEVIAGISVQLIRKDVKNISIRILPPDGAVRITTPRRTTEATVHRIVTERLGWIRGKQDQVRNAPRPPALEVKTGETHYLWGKPYVLDVVERASRPKTEFDGESLRVTVPVDADTQTRQAVLDRFLRKQLEVVSHELIAIWQGRMDVSPQVITVRKMKTRWGTCNTQTGKVTLNLDLVRRDPIFLEYVVIHELAHLIERGHNPRFYAVMDQYSPRWRTLRTELNRNPSAIVHDLV